MPARKATTSKPAAGKAASKQPATRRKAPARKKQEERILLPANLEMSGLDEAFSQLRGYYPPKFQKCILDGADINVIDASGVQLLINFVRSIEDKGCSVEWDNYSLQAYQLANEMGLVEQLGD